MKKLLCVLLMIAFLSGCTVSPQPENQSTDKNITAVWIFFDELSMKDLQGGTGEEYRERIDKMFDNCVSRGVNTVFFHVRPYGDAFYKSEIFPWTAYLTGKQGQGVDYDPLQIALDSAHAKGLTLHAWINPFRIAVKEDISLLSEDNPALKWIKSKSPDVVNINKGYYYSPASINAQKLITDGVREIVKRYDVDGIHIDDYFYPSTDKCVDEYYYKAYKKSGGGMKLSEWRRSNISALVSQLYKATKSRNENCIFSVSPQGNIRNNYDGQFADVRLWMKEEGYADWIIPQVYYGFENEFLPFDNACDAWAEMKKCESVKLIFGLAPYKINNGEDEWDEDAGIMEKQLGYIYSKKNCCGAAFFSYKSIVENDFPLTVSLELPAK